MRDTHGTDDKNPLPFQAVKRAHRDRRCWRTRGRFVVLPLPNVTNVFYGRDVGYTVERLVLDEETERISATQIRRELAAPSK